jgi:hypothetical protein
MQNETEITIGKGKDAVKYGILFNNYAIMEAETSFGVDLRKFNFIKSPSEMIILFYCGIIAYCAKYRIKPIDWEQFYDLADSGEIETGQIKGIVEAFQNSTVISNFIKSVGEAVEEFNKKNEKEAETEKKKTAKASLKKGILPSTKD